ncbi:hypothetical protein B0H19DRAFT_1138871 [Mycena capillaripes]|nr:hypothetical protein B0H19DRAFT_1138871 [Mycena capillaripes]
MSFDLLGADVLLQIFGLTDVYTIMSLSRVNRPFHEIVSVKQLWLSVVRNLSLTRLIDAPGDETLQTFSTEDLIGEVRRVVDGPRTWSSASLLPPTVLRNFNLPLASNSLDTGQPKLLSGGTHMLVYVPGSRANFPSGIEYWEVHTGRRMWEWGRRDYFVDHVASKFCAGVACKVLVLIMFYNELALPVIFLYSVFPSRILLQPPY